MKLRGKTMEEIKGKPIITFSNGLTNEAIAELATKIEHLDKIFNQVQITINDGHIEAVIANLQRLRNLYIEYQQSLYTRKTKLNYIKDKLER